VSVKGTGPAAAYCLIKTDPDAPSRKVRVLLAPFPHSNLIRSFTQEPLFREFVHWVVANIPAIPSTESHIPSKVNLAQGHVIAPYVGAGPPHASGLHRYCPFLQMPLPLLDLPPTLCSPAFHLVQNARCVPVSLTHDPAFVCPQISLFAVPPAGANVARSSGRCDLLLQPKVRVCATAVLLPLIKSAV
jgi:hypothetical protein